MSHPALAKRSAADLEQTLQKLFGSQAHFEPLADPDEMGRRVHGVDLKKPLLPAQAEFMVTLLDHFSVLSFPDPGDDDFSLRYLERLANHFGAPIPHPTNYANYLEHKKTGAPLQLQPPERQAANLCDLAFPHHIKCVAGADSPAVLADAGWLAPLVYVNPRTGTKSLHSPIWASRGKNIAPVEVDGLSDHDSRLFLDELESHVLQPKYRYDHEHRAGDITIWSNFSTLHNAPPSKSVINAPADARLMYRISSKGEPCHTLPRADTDAWIQANISPPYRTPQS